MQTGWGRIGMRVRYATCEFSFKGIHGSRLIGSAVALDERAARTGGALHGISRSVARRADRLGVGNVQANPKIRRRGLESGSSLSFAPYHRLSPNCCQKTFFLVPYYGVLGALFPLHLSFIRAQIMRFSRPLLVLLQKASAYYVLRLSQSIPYTIPTYCTAI